MFSGSSILVTGGTGSFGKKFIGSVLKANTSFHAYETLLFPALGPLFEIKAYAEVNGGKKGFMMPWYPKFHRDFYAANKRPTRAIDALNNSGLLRQGRLGQSDVFYFFAKETARFFTENIFPIEPDILFCKPSQDIAPCQECGMIVDHMKTLYADQKGAWDSQKIRAGMSKEFLTLLEPSVRRVRYL